MAWIDQFLGIFANASEKTDVILDQVINQFSRAIDIGEKLNVARNESKRLTRGEAIKLFCLECMGYTKHRSNPVGSVTKGGASSEVKKCTDTECPLYRYKSGIEMGENRIKRPRKEEPATKI
jgi:hypothetical protein